MDPFEKHGIKHLSPSSLATYRGDPAYWVMSYLYKVRGDGSESMSRGKAVEAALDLLLADRSQDEATAEAQRIFELNVGGEISEDTDEERKNIPAFVGQLVLARSSLPAGRPTIMQGRMEARFDGIEVPVWGVSDYEWPRIIVDLKTTNRMPSKPKPDHVVQVSLYGKTRDKAVQLFYVTPKKWALYPIAPDEVTEAYARLEQSAHANRALLDAFETKEQIARLFVPDFDNFRWDDKTKEAAKQVWH